MRDILGSFFRIQDVVISHLFVLEVWLLRLFILLLVSD